MGGKGTGECHPSHGTRQRTGDQWWLGATNGGATRSPSQCRHGVVLRHDHTSGSWGGSGATPTPPAARTASVLRHDETGVGGRGERGWFRDHPGAPQTVSPGSGDDPPRVDRPRPPGGVNAWQTHPVEAAGRWSGTPDSPRPSLARRRRTDSRRSRHEQGGIGTIVSPPPANASNRGG